MALPHRSSAAVETQSLRWEAESVLSGAFYEGKANLYKQSATFQLKKQWKAETEGIDIPMLVLFHGNGRFASRDSFQGGTP
jgi:hypothetical protein